MVSERNRCFDEFCTPFVMSTTTLAPILSGPNVQILSAPSLSHENCSCSILVRSLGSVLGPMTSFSISSQRPSASGCAEQYSLFSLLMDLARHTCDDSSAMVSLYVTRGSDFLISDCAYSSSRSLRQISTCSSPLSATIFLINLLLPDREQVY